MGARAEPSGDGRPTWPRVAVGGTAAAITILLLGACARNAPTLYRPHLDASLLLPCTDPVLASIGASDNEVAAERLRVARAYIDCRDKHAALADRLGAAP